jgi:type I restriction enzyme S subunit
MTNMATNSSFDITLENTESLTGRLIESEGDFTTEGVALQPVDPLFGKLRPYLAKAWVADRNGAAVGDFHALSPRSNVVNLDQVERIRI